jgi:hypothetical protein
MTVEEMEARDDLKRVVEFYDKHAPTIDHFVFVTTHDH